MKTCLRCKVGKEFYSEKNKYCKKCICEWARIARAKMSAKWRIERKCKYCPKLFVPKLSHQVVCDHRTCRGYYKIVREKNRMAHKKYCSTEHGKAVKREGYHRRNKENPIRGKASRFIGNLQWGIGGVDKMDSLMRKYLDKPCHWCGTILTVENISMDHRRPIHHAKIKDYYPQELKELNSPENLRFICKPCNQMKSDIPEEKFEKLLKWLKDDPILEQHVLRRLRTSNLMWFGRRKSHV